MENKNHYLYMLRCSDKSLYTGITPDITARIKTHYYKEPGCAKYTRSRNIEAISAVWLCDSKTAAAKLEYRIKRLNKEQKENLVKGEIDIHDIMDSEFTAKRLNITLEQIITKDTEK